MERGEYERLAAAEERMWWFHGLHANLLAAWRAAARPAPQPRLLDAGCGTGGLMARLAAAAPDARILGLDIDAGAATMARDTSGRAVCVASTAALPFADASLDGVFSADVLCHRGIDAAASLASIHRCLRPGGVLILNLPAYRWLFSAHDVAVDNARRFGRAETERLLAAAGFARIRSRYWNTILFPLMVLRRKLKPAGAASDVALLPAPIERMFRALIACESRLFRAGVRLPFGGSILATAVKP